MGERVRLLLQFENEPGAEELGELERRGMKAVAYVPDQALIVNAPAAADLSGLRLLFAGPLEGADKFSPLFSTLDITEFTDALIVLQEDADEATVRGVLAGQGFRFKHHPDLPPGRLLATAPVSILRQAAELDDVQYILPASRELSRGEVVHVCAGVASPVAQLVAAAELSSSFGEGWDGPGRGKASLEYFFGSLTSLHPSEPVKAELRKAVDAWSAAVDVTFAEASSAGRNRSLDFTFFAGDHGDGFPFDGPGKSLAHTFFPPPATEPQAGDIHFDLAEPWRIGNDPDLFSVALHELGHALGLTHSDDPNAVMYPYYRRYAALSASDLESIRQLYATRQAVQPPPPVLPPIFPPVNPPSPDPPGTPDPPVTNPDPPVTNPDPPGNPDPPSEEPEAKDTAAPSLTIDFPLYATYATTSAQVVVWGRASDNKKLKTILWESSTGPSGSANGLENWKTPPIDLHKGVNRITIRAVDMEGNSSWRGFVVTRR